MEEEKQKILLIEDEEDNRYFMMHHLQKAGYDVVEAANGEDGLKKIEEAKPDLVILDVILPGINGWQVLKHLKTKFKGIPVIMLTVKGSDKDKLGGYIIGADYYISKPFNIPLLLRAVEQLL